MLITRLLLILYLCAINFAADSVVDDSNSVVSTYNAHDVQNFRRDLFTQLDNLRTMMANLELDFTTLNVCITKAPIWFPSIPVWLEGNSHAMDKLGSLIVKSLDEIDYTVHRIDQGDISSAVRRVDLLFYRLQIDGARYRRRIARRFQRIYSITDLV